MPVGFPALLYFLPDRVLCFGFTLKLCAEEYIESHLLSFGGRFSLQNDVKPYGTLVVSYALYIITCIAPKLVVKTPIRKITIRRCHPLLF